MLQVIIGIIGIILIVYGLIYTSTPEGNAAYEARRKAYKAANRHGKKWLAQRLAEIDAQEKAAKIKRTNND